MYYSRQNKAPKTRGSVTDRLTSAVVPRVATINASNECYIAVAFGGRVSSSKVDRSMASPGTSVTSISLIRPCRRRLGVCFGSPLSSLGAAGVAFSNVTYISK